ncbi:MAG: hypothetical protein L0H19_00845 [Salinisphaera sp.]|nr:hypothetical protein [Salinisphaera sp.]
MRALQAIGFTDYEARVYAALIGQEPLNGYELAKRTGIPRANIYPVLDKLVSRAAVLRIERQDGARYAAVDPATLLGEIESGQRQALARARRELASLSRHQESPAVFNLHGEAWLLQAHRLIANTEKSLLIAIQPREAAALAEPLRAAREQGTAITTLCMQSCPDNCGHCQGDVHCYQFQHGGGERWLVLVADNHQTLVGRFDDAGSDAILTSQPLTVRLAAAYIQQSLTLAVLGGELADRFDGLLSIEARRVLDRMAPQDDFIAWLKQVNGCAA